MVNKLLVSTILATCSILAQAQTFLPDMMAFKATANMKDKNTLEVIWTIEPGYKMYKKSLSFVSQGNVVLGSPEIPKGKVEFNQALGETIEQFDTTIKITIPVTSKGNFKLIAKGQGCANAGLCYPPFERVLELKELKKVK